MMQRNPERLLLSAASALLAACCFALAVPAARAHPGPAESPDFGEPDCITVVDIRSTPVLTIDYMLAFDDVMSEPDHIGLADSKTHTFYAFRGQVSANWPDFTLAPFDANASAQPALPLWLDADDVTRAVAANTPMIAPNFHAEDVGHDLLHEREDLAGLWLPIAGEKRVPITQRQSRFGVRWDVSMFEAGVYQLVAYVFSPPYNAWEPRPGVIKLVDGQRDPPAVTVDSIDASLFSGQGRKITGCVNAPPGSELKAWARSDPNAPWQLWTTQAIAENGRFELCYRNAGVSGLVQMRVGASTPAGDETVAYAADQLTLVANDAPCTPSAKLCCEAAATSMTTLAAGSAGPTSLTTAGAAALAAGSAAPPPSAAGSPAAAPPPPSSASSGPCALREARGSARDHRGLCALALLLGALAYRRRRRNASECRSAAVSGRVAHAHTSRQSADRAVL